MEEEEEVRDSAYKKKPKKASQGRPPLPPCKPSAPASAPVPSSCICPLFSNLFPLPYFMAAFAFNTLNALTFFSLQCECNLGLGWLKHTSKSNIHPSTILPGPESHVVLCVEKNK